MEHMSVTEEVAKLRTYWSDILDGMENQKIFSGGVLDRATAWDIFHTICTFYNSPNRYHHRLTHVLDMLENLEYQIPLGGILIDKISIQVGIIFHDSIMDQINGKSELSSASFLYQCLDVLRTEHSFKVHVGDMILNTDYSENPHTKNLSPESKVLIDLDLHILSRVWPEYLDYMNNIRKEYDVYNDHIFYYGRKVFLKKMLRWPTIFQTSEFIRKYDQPARDNILCECNYIDRKSLSIGQMIEIINFYNIT